MPLTLSLCIYLFTLKIELYFYEVIFLDMVYNEGKKNPCSSKKKLFQFIPSNLKFCDCAYNFLFYVIGKISLILHHQDHSHGKFCDYCEKFVLL